MSDLNGTAQKSTAEMLGSCLASVILLAVALGVAILLVAGSFSFFWWLLDVFGVR